MFLISLDKTLQMQPSKVMFFWFGLVKSVKKNDNIEKKVIDSKDRLL